MATNDAPLLRQSVRWGEEYVSRALNMKMAGIVKPGVYHGFVLKPGGTMSVLVDHGSDYPRSVAVVERNGYSLTVVMDDPGLVRIPATGTWFVCLEAFYAPTQQGYQRIVVREQPEPHHVVLGKVRAGMPLTEPGEDEGDDGDGEASAPGEAVVITEDMISSDEIDKANADIATVRQMEALSEQLERHTRRTLILHAESTTRMIHLSRRLTTLALTGSAAAGDEDTYSPASPANRG
ncbi:hypothetical protein [Desulfovibrio sp. SGI.169]|uniref:hypothetical protein n=1 Tax=Desulfovibrio sp. SGI.169 TaxID=3420561 RepID=UPI003D064F40